MNLKRLALGLVLLFMCNNLFAQSYDTAFSKQWIIIDSLLGISNLPKSALSNVKEVYKLAELKSNKVQQVKALLYQIAIENYITEKDINHNNRALQNELNKNKEADIQALLHVLIAKQYQEYFNDHRWQLYQRTNTTAVKKEDILSWGADDFLQAIETEYLLSLKNKELLKKISLEKYEVLILKGNATYLRPTLFDLIAHDALDYFKTGQGSRTRPINDYSIQQREALSAFSIFTTTSLQTSDSAAHAFKALQLFQELIRFHAHDSNKAALIMVDIDRINWVNQQVLFENKISLKEAALTAIAKEFKSDPASAYALFQIAKDKAELAGSYLANLDSSYRWKYQETMQLIKEIKQQFSDPKDNPVEGSLENLKQRILSKNLNVESELVNLPNKPFRALVKYKNIDTIYYRILSIPLEVTANERDREALVNQLCGYKSIVSNKQWIPSTGDYQYHSVEIKLDPLPNGEYVLLTSSGKDFNTYQDIINFQSFQVSNIAFIQNNRDFFILNRETGNPIPKATIKILAQLDYPYDLTWHEESKSTTVENGFFKLTSESNNRNYRFDIEAKNDHLRIFNNGYIEPNAKANQEEKDFEKENEKAFFFTDRSIYRPGQTVLFKSIITTLDKGTKKSKIVAQANATVYLKDVNNRTIDSLKMISNDYGSCTGKFVLPEKLLTGNFTLILNNRTYSAYRFSVEAYKRPTYTAQFEKISKAYRVNDSIELHGNANAFAGNFITGAKVSYHIVRNARPMYPYLRYSNFRYSPPQEIGQGTIQTDSKGAFTIRFKALPELSTDAATNPIFDYSIDATVTDPSGETRTAKQKISCGYQSLQLQVYHPQIINANNDTKINISVSNFNDQVQDALVHVKFIEIKAPERWIRERFWTRPDQFVMSKEDYINSFPLDLYDHENELNTYPILGTAIEVSIDTKNKKELLVNKSQLKTGYYQIEASTKDAEGNTVTYKNYVQVFDPQNNSLTSGNVHFLYGNDTMMEPGDKDTIYMGSVVKDLYVVRHIQKPDQKDIYTFINRKKGIEPFIYQASEQDRGGIHIEEMTVFQNRVYINRFTKTVPFTNKALDITYASYRNHTEPGSDEKWTIEIRGANGEKKAAELLTAMYDASLDEFKPHLWNQPNWWNYANHFDNWNFISNIGNQYSRNYYRDRIHWNIESEINYDQILYYFSDVWFNSLKEHKKRNEHPFINVGTGVGFYNPLVKMDDQKLNEVVITGSGSVAKKDIQLRGMAANSMPAPPPSNFKNANNSENHLESNTDQDSANPTETKIRKNFNETAFFFPQLYADSTGTYRFSFTMPDAVTKWKWMSFAHTRDLSSGMQTAYIQTQKTLMVQSNAPRFMREGDKMEFSTRIANMSDKELTGQITLELIDATTNTSIDGWFQNIFPTQYFTVGAKQTEAVKFPIQIPFSYNKPLIWRVVAKSGNYSDGEENVLAVLSNRGLVTESLPLLVNGDTTLQFHFDKLLHQNSSSLSNESLTVEFSSNPIWYAVQALPYLKEGMDNCAEAIFHKIYANSIAAYIVNKNPIIKTWFEQTKKDTASLLSNLQKNQQLKQVLLEETPWVLAANTEAERKKNLSELFDLLKLAESNQSAFEKLQELQLPNGAFSWFKGGYEDPYITTYILTGLGRLKRLGAIIPDMAIRFKPMILKAVQFTDDYFNTEYQNSLKYGIDPNLRYVSTSDIQWLYMRSFYGDIALKNTTASDFYTQQSKLYWKHFPVYYQSLIGLIQLRNKEEKFVGKTILPSIFENAVVDKQKGMYWKQAAWDWHSSTIETASMVIELASEYNQQNNSAERTKAMDAIKTWLILNKQTNNWKTSIKTANACYALLLNGTDWLKQQKTVQIALGKKVINSSDEKTTAGTGYFEKRIDGSIVDTTMGAIKVTTQTLNAGAQKNNQPAWGAIYWQYFEDYDKITEASSPLNIQKKLMIEKITDKGKELVPVDLNNPLKVGDKVVVRMLIKTDREMEYLHLKDMRAAGMEPVNILSGYKWQDGMGYYENTTDISSNFFISHLNKGTYVFEYPVYITHTGNFSVGIASIQCMYAPEFNSHSEGIRINVAE